MDFFSAVHHSDQLPVPTDAPDVAVFANAVASRHGTEDAANILRTRLTPVTEMPTPLPQAPMANMSLAPTSPLAFNAVPTSSLADYLNDPHTLVVDIRPHAAYTDARLPRALSLSVPSTLLKRPLFSLERIAAMLPSPSDRTRFSAFRESSRILVYDADAVYIPESSNIHGLLRKFKAASYPGELSWLRGGFQGVWREQHHLVDTGPKDHDDDDDQDSGPAHPSSPAPPTILRTKHLPMSAFSLSSTTASQSPTGSRRRPPFAHQHSSMPMHMSLPMSTSQPTARPAINPFFDTIRQNIELSHGITERIPLRLPTRVCRRIADLPFPWLQEIAKRTVRMPHKYRPHHHRPHSRPSSKRGIPFHLAHPVRSHPPTSSSSSSSSDSESSDSDTAPSSTFIEEGTEALAMQFYRIELAEQRRLMGVMEHHSKESGRFVVNGVYEETHASLAFPFSITAGVEKGAKNRYRHIWPFEHARVRLYTAGSHQDTDRGKSKDRVMTEVDDYVNASYVQPLGTNRRYIATQGPLDATFDDFWRLTWEQNVHVIVMLTKEIEGSMVKCGAYWADTEHPKHERTFGPLRLTLVSKVGLPASVDLMQGDPGSMHIPTQDGAGAGPGGFAFPPQGPPVAHQHKSRKRRVTTIKRTFSLTHVGYPHLGARTIVQLQYLEWPDMNVPDDARGVLGLVKEVECAVRETDTCESPVPMSPGPEDAERYRGKERKVKKEMRMDPGSGIARHALGGCRPVLLHCSAGVGRTGGFIAVDAVLDAIKREMWQERAMKKEAGKESEVKGYAAAMDVDQLPSMVTSPEQDKDRVVTVPLEVSGNTGLGMDGGVNVDTREGLVVHVPAVVVPPSGPMSDALPATAGVDVSRAPMQVDGDEVSLDSEETDVRPTALTRKWAESVSGSYASTGASKLTSGSSIPPFLSASPPPPSSSYASSSGSASGSAPAPRYLQSQTQQRHRFPSANVSSTLTSSASTSSVSAFPSISDSEDSLWMRRMRGGSGSALGRSGYRESSSLGTSVSDASVKSGKEREEELQQLAEQEKTQVEQEQGLQRFRTLSAPQPQARMKFPLSLGVSGAGGPGSSPLAKLAGAAQERQHAEEQWKADMEKTGSDIVLAVHHVPHPHPLSRSSPPLSDPRVAKRSLQSPQPPAYLPDPRVSSSFPERPVTTVDYKEPRALHGALETPVSLSEFEEPIWEVVQDMREQRMSLCQSLRQYVFVHAAIIEGALWIVDEQREREKEMVDWEKESGRVAEVDKEDEQTAAVLPVQETQNEREVGSRQLGFSPGPWSGDTPFRFTGDASSSGNTLSSHTLLQQPSPSSHVFRPSLPPLPIPQLPQFQRFNSNSSGGMSDSSSTSSTGKRGASPTELLKEGKQGEVLLSKRPSIKRKLQIPSPIVDAEKAMSGEAMSAGSPATGSMAAGSPLQQVTVPSSPMPCE